MPPRSPSAPRTIYTHTHIHPHCKHRPYPHSHSLTHTHTHTHTHKTGEPCRRSKLKCERVFPCLRCVKLGLPCDNPQADPELLSLTRNLSLRHGWPRLLSDLASKSLMEQSAIARSRPQNISKEKATLVLQSLTQVQYIYLYRERECYF